MQKRTYINRSNKEQIEVSAEVKFGFLINKNLSDGISEREQDSRGDHFGQNWVLLKESSVSGKHKKRKIYNFSGSNIRLIYKIFSIQ
jgi:hypothetical protein